MINKQNCMNNLNKNYSLDDSGRIVIDMVVKDDSDFLSVFSANQTPVISSDVAEFIENSTHSIRAGEPLTLRIKSNCIDNDEKELYKKAIKEYYSERYVAGARELKRNNVASLILALAGIFALIVALFLQYSFDSLIWAEVVDIAAWVFLWETVDIIFFKTRHLRNNQKRYASFINMNIEYQDITN